MRRPSMYFAAGAAAVALLSTGAATGATPTFTALTPVPTGAGPAGLASGDLNGDGKVDLVSANGSESSVSVLIGSGTGAFTPATVPAGFNVNAVAAGDLNGDGRADLAVAMADDTVAPMIQGALGTFAQGEIKLLSAANRRGVAVGDVTGDGIADIVAANTGLHTISVIPGTGNGAFGSEFQVPLAPTPTGAQAPRGLVLGDLNGDSRLDAVTANAGTGNISLLIGAGGGFAPATIVPADTDARGLALGDVSGDGRLDVVTANQAANSVSVFLGRGDGTVLPALTTGLAGGPNAVATGDLDGDLGIDVAVSTAAGPIQVMSGTGTGGFLATTNVGSAAGPRGVIVRDFDADGRADLAVPNVSANIVSVHANATAFPPPGATLLPAGSVTATEAVLRGVVVPRGRPASYRFEYGTSAAYGSLTSIRDAGSGVGDVPVSEPLTGLVPETTYHYRLVASAPFGSSATADGTFTTPALPDVLSVTGVRVTPRWRASRFRGRLTLVGTSTIAGPASVRITANRAGRAAAQITRRVDLPVGPFTRRVALTSDILPGRLSVTIAPNGGRPETATAVLAAPPEGVADRAEASGRRRGPAATTLTARGRRIIYATFHFAALPKPGRNITTTWVLPNGQVAASFGKPRSRIVESYWTDPTRGTWRCILRVNGVVVATTRIRLT